jgi:hypothetical protein
LGEKRHLWRYHSFFKRDKDAFDADLALKNMLGVSAPGDDPAHPPVNVDPNPPSMDFPGLWWVDLVCRILPFTAIVSIWMAFSRHAGSRRRIAVLIVLLVLNAWALYSHGKYSEKAFDGFTYAIWFAYLGLAVPFLRRLLRWVNEPRAEVVRE